MNNDKIQAALARTERFWESLADWDNGGFYGLVSRDGAIDKKAVKGCILNSRILWFFSKTGNRKYAEHAFGFMRRKFFDRDRGGLFWSANADGTPADTSKHIYCQAFGLYALAAYRKISTDNGVFDYAVELFNAIEASFDGEGYGEAFNRDFTPADNGKLSENGVEARRTMNTLLHIFEAYSEFYPASRKLAPAVEMNMRRILDIFKTKVYNPEKARLDVFFGEKYNPLIDLQSYGHDIEASWLLDWGTFTLGDERLYNEISGMTLKLAESVYSRAFRDGSLFNENERGADDERRVWWVQSEAVQGFYHAFDKTGDVKFRDAAERILEFTETKLTDPDTGEWYSEIAPDGSVPGLPLVDPWKCPYHNGRMFLRLLGR